MDGLEAVEVKYSEVLMDKDNVRFDSEYYYKDYLKIENIIENNKTKFTQFTNLDLKIDASAFYPALEPYYNQGEFSFIRVGDVKEFVDFDNCIKIPYEILSEFTTLKKVKKGDIVLTKGGTIAKAGLISQACSVSRDLIFINSSTLNEFDYTTLYLYLLSDFAYKQLIRSSSQSVQPHLTVTLVKKLSIFKFSNDFKIFITKLYNYIVKIFEESKVEYKQAEKLLLQELDLTDWTPTNKGFSIKSINKSFKVSGRLDSEYYQPKYDEVLSKITKVNNLKLKDIVRIKKSIEPGSSAYQDEGLPFIRVSNLTKYGITQPDICIPYNVTNNIEDLKPKKDTILLSKDGSIGIAYKVEENLEAITSGAILHLRIKNKNILPDYLTLVLNSILTQLQAERDSGGSIIQHWRLSDIEDILIPILDIDMQKRISEKIQEAFKLKKESEYLLEIAKTGVEKAVQEGEETAIEWINTMINKLEGGYKLCQD